jgi:transposase-like protein
MDKDKNKLTDKQKIFLKSYADNYNKAKACREAGVSRPTMYNWIRDIKSFEESIKSIDEAYVDISEAVLKETLVNGYKTDKSGELIMIKHPETGEMVAQRSKEAIDAAKFVLSRKGKTRGYVEAIDINSDMRAMQTKLLAREEVIDITPEEMKQLTLETLKNG